MKSLQAPWRMPYIQASQKAESGCVFCHLANPETDAEEGLVLFRDRFVLIALNRYPYNNGHLLVMPAAHGADFAALDAETATQLMKRVQQTAAILQKAYRCPGLNIGMNLGAVAGAGITDHMHFHVLPRWQGDTNFMPVIADVRVMPQYLHETWSNLLPYFKELGD